MRGLLLALAAAALFGAAAPASKQLLKVFEPLQLAGLLYLGAALATGPAVLVDRRRRRLDRRNRLRLAGVILLGGVVAPISLLAALRLAPASAVSLLLNLEIVATAVLGVGFFHEHLRRRAWAGVAGIVIASALVSGDAGRPGFIAALLVVGACTCWGIDNHLSALIDGMTPARSTFWKGAAAGTVNVLVSVLHAPLSAPAAAVVAALAVGAVSYGASIALHTAAAQRVGAVRAQAVFATAPFFGAALCFAFLGERLTAVQALATLLLAASVGMLVAGRHEHAHSHEAIEHIHAHSHDDGHHLHDHAAAVVGTHTHWHRHDPIEHVHPHWPDLHHRHPHD
jgi:drug/metabolite transporter (DMT)-like permease